ncbi:MAG: DUF948 domain-containing protein [Actinomycetota bacterium]|nr:DUF948 domain-containing protein [Actinomycetota bacterium]
MSGSDWAWIIAAGFWGLLVIVLCIVLLNVFRLISQVTALVEGVTRETVPLLGSLGETVSGVNVELARVDSIVAGVQSITAKADNLVGLLQATVSNPLVKVAAFATGARRGLKKLRE